jgi:hypothetical protein
VLKHAGRRGRQIGFVQVKSAISQFLVFWWRLKAKKSIHNIKHKLTLYSVSSVGPIKADIQYDLEISTN